MALAALALWQLRLYGAPITRDVQGAFGLDPLLVAAPAIGLLAGAVLAVRIVPRVAEVLERVLSRRHDLLAPHGARQLARRPLRYTPTALLLLLAAALGTFAAAYHATWTRSQADQAAYAAAGDVRIVMGSGGRLRPWQLGPVLRGLDGVGAAVPIVRGTVSAGTALRQAELIAVEPARTGPLVADAPSLAGGPGPATILAELGAAARPIPGVQLPDGARRLGVDLQAALTARIGEQVQPGEIKVVAVLAGPDGVVRIEAAEPVPFGATRRAVIGLAAGEGTIAGPLHLVGLELAFATPEFAALVGWVTLGEVATSAADTGDEWRATEFAPGLPDWTWQRVASPGFRPLDPADPATIDVGPDVGGRPTVLGPIATGPSSEGLLALRLTVRTAITGPVPAIANPAFLAGAGRGVGERLLTSIGGERVEVDLIGTAESFPPLDPARPFLIADTLALGLQRYAATGTVTAPREWWLKADPAREAAIVATVGEPPFVTTDVIARGDLAHDLATDVVPLGVIGALAIGALAAAVVAAIGFLMSATASISERLAEFALLRALGVSGRAIARWLVVEQVGLLAFGLAVGTGLGTLLAWLVLPFASLTSSGTTPIPPPAVVIPWASVAAASAAAGVVLAAAAAILTRRIPGLSLGGLLRSRDG